MDIRYGSESSECSLLGGTAPGHLPAETASNLKRIQALNTTVSPQQLPLRISFGETSIFLLI